MYLKAAGTSIQLTATNLALGITQLIGAEVHRGFEVTVPLKPLAESLAGLPPETLIGLTHEAKGEKLFFDVPTGFVRHWHLMGISAQEYPFGVYVETPTSAAIALAGALLRATFSHILPSIALDEARAVLGGLHFKLSADGQVVAEGADGFRLHTETIPTSARGQAYDLVIPRDAIRELIKLISPDEDVLLDIVYNTGTPNRVIVSQPGWQLSSQLIEGVFPDVNPLMPKTMQTKVAFPRDSLSSALAGAKTYSRQCAYTGRFRIKPAIGDAPGQLKFLVVSQEQGEFAADIDATVEGGGALSFACNTDYLSQALAQLDLATVNLGLNSPTSPLVIRENGFTAVLMPMGMPS